MEIAVLTEPLPNGGYKALTGPPLSMEAEGPTPESAENRLAELIGQRVRNGARVKTVSIGVEQPPPLEPHPLAQFAGSIPDDALFKEWQEAVAEIRRQKDLEDADR